MPAVMVLYQTDSPDSDAVIMQISDPHIDTITSTSYTAETYFIFRDRFEIIYRVCRSIIARPVRSRINLL